MQYELRHIALNRVVPKKFMRIHQSNAILLPVHCNRVSFHTSLAAGPARTTATASSSRGAGLAWSRGTSIALARAVDGLVDGLGRWLRRRALRVELRVVAYVYMSI